MEMLPLLLSESPRADLFQAFSSRFISQFEALKQKNWATERENMHHLDSGGLPGICFRRDRSVRNQLFSVHLDTILGRDLQSLYGSRIPLEKLKRLYGEISKIQGLPVNELALARQIGATAPNPDSIKPLRLLSIESC
jgi:hypothetical protein